MRERDQPACRQTLRAYLLSRSGSAPRHRLAQFAEGGDWLPELARDGSRLQRLRRDLEIVALDAVQLADQPFQHDRPDVARDGRGKRGEVRRGTDAERFEAGFQRSADAPYLAHQPMLEKPAPQFGVVEVDYPTPHLLRRFRDPKSLRQIAANARAKGELAVAHAADLRLYSILPAEAPGTFEHDVWQSIHALEGTLTIERGKTTRLGRTRQKIARVGELDTIKDLVLATKASEGFSMLIERQMGDLAFEAVILRHPDRFDMTVLDAAVERLRSVGIERQPSG